jgi:uncharacterized protein YndB with AHSA1/START domain
MTGVDYSIEASLHSKGTEGVIRMRARYETDIDDLWSAITETGRLVDWYGKVEGDLRVGGEFTAFVYGSEWDGRGHIDACTPLHSFRLAQSEDEGPEVVVTVELVANGVETGLEAEIIGPPLDMLFAYGAGWHTHLRGLGDYLAGRPAGDRSSAWLATWEELAPLYREKAVEATGP